MSNDAQQDTGRRAADRSCAFGFLDRRSRPSGGHRDWMVAFALVWFDRDVNELVMDREAFRIDIRRERTGRDERDDHGIFARSDAPEVEIGDERVAILDRLADFGFELGIGSGVDEHSPGVAKQIP